MKNKIIVIVIISLFILSVLLMFLPFSSTISTLKTHTIQTQESTYNTRSGSSIGSSWTQDTASDFSAGTLENVVIRSEGKIELELQYKSIVDEFTNETKISEKENVIVETETGSVKLARSSNENFNMIFGGKENDYSNEIIQTSDGGYAVIGETFSYGAGDANVWLIKTNCSGNEQWNITFGGNKYDSGYDLIQTLDGGYAITGSTCSYGVGSTPDVWLIKTDAFGNKQWDKTFGSLDSEVGFSLQQTSDGGYIIGGYTQLLWGIDSDVLLIKTDSSGNEQWNKTFGGSFGRDFGWDIVQTSDGGYAIIGETDSYGTGTSDVWLIKTNSSGIVQWNKTFGGKSGRDFGWDIIQTSDGGYAISGVTESYGAGETDVWLIKTNNSGFERWNKTFGGIRYDSGKSILQTSDGGYAIIGETKSYGKGGSNIWLIKTDNIGNEQWNKTFGGNNDDSGSDILQTPNGGYVVASNTESHGAGGTDVWLIKINENGNFLVGMLKSTNLLFNEAVRLIDKFECFTNIPQYTSIQVRFSQNGLNWYDALGVVNASNILFDGSNSIDITGLNWSGSEFYYELQFTTDGIDIPGIYNIELKYNQYSSSGIYISKPFNGEEKASWKVLSWLAATHPNTSIKFKLRTAANEFELSTKNFIGPDGTTSNYYSKPGKIYSEHCGDSWLQYKLFLETTKMNQTPILNNVTIAYNCFPKLIFPLVTHSKGDITTLFNFMVGYLDKDNDSPAYIKVCIDGMNYSMLENNSVDIDYSDGKNYWYTTKLPAGNRTYRFFTSDEELDCCTNLTDLKVDFGPLDHITVEPSLKTITTDDYQIFTAKGFDADGNSLSISPNWEVSGGGIIDQTGNFTATTPGSWLIYANVSGISGNATINITPGGLNKIIITPQTGKITTDDFLLFMATGYDADNNELPISSHWNISGGGTIDQNGNFTATTPGAWTVYVNYSGINATSEVMVTIGELNQIIILPNYVEINESNSFTFAAKGYDADNNELKISPKWEVSGNGTIDRNGKFFVSKPGTWIVYANFSGISGNATIKVIPIEDEKEIHADKEEEEKSENILLIVGIGIFIIIIVVVVIILFFFIKKKRKKSKDEKDVKTGEIQNEQQQDTQKLQLKQQQQAIQPQTKPNQTGVPIFSGLSICPKCGNVLILFQDDSSFCSICGYIGKKLQNGN